MQKLSRLTLIERKSKNMKRMVMAVSNWPESESDFVVTRVRDGETEADAIQRAKELYSEDMEFYIVEE